MNEKFSETALLSLTDLENFTHLQQINSIFLIYVSGHES